MNSPKRVLLIIPITSYRASAFLDAAEQLGVEIVVATERPTLSALTADTTISVNFAQPLIAVERIVAFARRKPFDAILGVDERGVIMAAMASAELGLPHNPVEAVRATRDKFLMRQKLKAGGVPVPKFRRFPLDLETEKIAALIGFPAVVKPVFLAASRGVIRVDNVDQLDTALTLNRHILADYALAEEGGVAATRILIEDYIPGEEVALEAILNDGQMKPLALFDKPDPLIGPYFAETLYTTPSRLPDDLQQEIIATSEQAARALGLTSGPIHAELRLNDDGIWTIEIAARSIGGLCSKILRFSDGISLEVLILKQALGHDISQIEREDRAAGVMMLPVPKPGILRQVDGAEAARTGDHIEEVLITITPNRDVQALPQSGVYLGFIFARGENPDIVEQAIRHAQQKLDIHIDENSAN